MEIGVAEGYFGIAGFDLLLDKHGEVFAIDLNFRQNGSTSMLLLEPELQGRYHKFFIMTVIGIRMKLLNQGLVVFGTEKVKC